MSNEETDSVNEPTADESQDAEAFCFTAGYKGVPFAAGVIHACLAADRRPPKIAAGISSGALAAAAMQRAYRELAASEGEPAATREAKRWRWFRRYLEAISDKPFDVLWKAFPDPVDFFSDKLPVRDPSSPAELRADEAAARRRYFLLVQLGRWLAGLSVQVGDVARAVVAFVRYKERYGGLRPWLWLHYQLLRLRLLLSVFIHICVTPEWIPEWKLWSAGPSVSWLRNCWRRIGRCLRPIRPLFGWTLWLTTIVITCVVPYGLVGGAVILVAWLWPAAGDAALRLSAELPSLRWVVGGALVVDVVLVVVLIASWVVYRFKRQGSKRFSGWILRQLASMVGKQLGVRRGLLHDYVLHRTLRELFAEPGGAEPEVSDEPLRILLAAAPLQSISDLSGQQVWPRPGTSLITALRAALAVPGVFAPVSMTDDDEKHNWLSDEIELPRLDLVDGSVVRKNPIPALFAFLQRNPEVGRALESSSQADPRLHIVYSVPIEPATTNEARERLDIVDAVMTSLELASRRDTELESRQTNFISQLERQIRLTGAAPDRFQIFADAVTPADDIRFANSLDPTREEILTLAATGCRRTLERLYRKEIAGGNGIRPLGSCPVLLRRIAPHRRPFVADEAPGLPEICSRCPRTFANRPPRQPSFEATYGLADGRSSLAAEFPQLTGEEPRIVFVASGGVFRGASHIGVLAALRSTGVYPDLVVGASVGALLGGALAAASVLDDFKARRLIASLADAFLKVDERVALTRTIKNAARQLGVRGRRIDLSPRRLRYLIDRGTRSNPGFAAAGAPPALIDAISSLFLLPHTSTAKIAAEFVAGHFAKATDDFFNELKLETLKSLDVQYALMGTSLLEPLARILLGESFDLDLDRVQPYHAEERRVSFFGTTTLVNTREMLVLGRDFPCSSPTYDFVQAGLSSSAFPGIFSPRQEAEVLPGVGRTDVLFADGGMFDNLPFFAALQILAAVQRDHHDRKRMSPIKFLRQRYEKPDLFIAGALEEDPAVNSRDEFRDLVSIHQRGRSLKNNLKIDAYSRSAEAISEQIGRLCDKAAPNNAKTNRLVNTLVHAAVLKIVPTDADHINPTFAFCASTGLDPRRVALAIADGCYQTLATLADRQAEGASTSLAAESVAKLTENGRIPQIRRREGDPPIAGKCPYFLVKGEEHDCPFFQAAREGGSEFAHVRDVYTGCRSDPAHH